MRYKELTSVDKDLIKRVYAPNYKINGELLSMAEKQDKLATYFGVTTRAIRKWAKKMELGLMRKNIVNPSKILIYDIETSRVNAKVFWTGKQFISHNQIQEEPKIITISWKWLYDDKIHHLTWDKNHNDVDMVKNFSTVYNSADMVVGVNNNNFDNRWLNARIAKYSGYVNTYVRSFDIQKECKRLFRLPSYSMSYLANYFDVTLKQNHEGIIMWDKVEQGTKEEQEEYLQKMIDYNIGDIVTTEELFLRLRKYMGNKVHLGVLQGGDRYNCPHCGGGNIELVKVTATAAGTLQYIMRCLDDGVEFKLSAYQYNKFLDEKLENGFGY